MIYNQAINKARGCISREHNPGRGFLHPINTLEGVYRVLDVLMTISYDVHHDGSRRLRLPAGWTPLKS